MKTYQYVLLDWDGNLAKTLDIWLHATRKPLEKRGIVVPDQQIALQCFGRPVEGYGELGVNDVEAAIEEMDVLAAALMPEVELYPDTPYVLEELKKTGKQTALITSNFYKNVTHVLEKYHLRHFFDVIITNEDTIHHKPHPEPLDKALEQLGGTKDRAIMIGDSDKDLEAAKNAGIDSLLFYPEEHKKFYRLDNLKKFEPTHIVNDFRNVMDVV